METISLEDIRESGHIKVETCKSCMEDLKGIFTKEQLQWFEDIFIPIWQDAYLKGRKVKVMKIHDIRGNHMLQGT